MYVISELVQNEGQECWYTCNQKKGECSWCGSGVCCRKEDVQWKEIGDGCDGTFGGEGAHVCVQKPGTGFNGTQVYI